MAQQSSKNTLCIRYALTILKGKFKDCKVFTQLVDSMVNVQDRKERGVGLQNFSHPPELDKFAHMCAIISPEVYRMLWREFSMWTICNFQQVLFSYNTGHGLLIITLRIKRSCALSFPITICERNLDLASEYLSSLKYPGPVGLSCDNTKLHLSLRTYWDADKGCHFLVGTTGEPIAV